MQAELEKIAKAIGDFYAREGVLFDKDLGERALTHRLAVAIEKQFDGWDVDCDYNRLGERLMRLPHGSIVSTDDELGKSIFPDIAVHRRAVPEIFWWWKCARPPITSRSSTITTSCAA